MEKISFLFIKLRNMSRNLGEPDVGTRFASKCSYSAIRVLPDF